LAALLERGEERFITAMETGFTSINLAVDFARSDAGKGPIYKCPLTTKRRVIS
jgi:hypothetical protein